MSTWIGMARRGLIGTCLAIVLDACSGGGGSSMAGVAVPAVAAVQAVCPSVPAGRAHCDALLRTDLGMSVDEFSRTTQSLRTIQRLPGALGPDDLSAAYGYTTSGGGGQTIALIDAYDNSNIESDLAVYRSRYNLPPCTTANGCFTKVAQDGSKNYPTTNLAWAAEAAVDTQIASAICPNCKILLVEGNSDNLADLATATERAIAMGATVVSNSFGSVEWSGESGLESHWHHPGVVITASAGDDAAQVEFPAASQYVVAVGGTDLGRDASRRGYTDSVWSGGAAGCSAYITKPSWQHDSGCTHRTVSDVSFVASTDLPVAIYQTSCGSTICGWTAYSGTSVGAPAIAALFALAGNAANRNFAADLYSAPSTAFHDVTNGSDGACGTYLCQASVGYDAPSGLGTPNGLTAF